MKTILIDGKDYKLEYTFEACLDKKLVKDMFNVLTSSYFFKEDGTDKSESAKVLDGMSAMVSDVPQITFNAFYIGLKENHDDMTEEKAKKLLKIYMKDHKCNFYDVFEIEKEVMEDDGFFEQSGVISMMNRMTESIETVTKEVEQEIQEVNPKKKQTSKK